MRKVVTLFQADGAGQMRASLSSMESGFSSLRTKMEMTQRTGGIVDKQMKALGTTLRYAFSGSVVYGSFQMLQNFSQFSSRLGEISTIATGAGGLPMVNKQINELGQDLLDVSNKTAQPIDDLQQGILTLYSTIGDIPPNKAADMMEEISKVAVTSQSDIVSTTNALLGMIDAFGRGTDEIKGFGNEFYKVVKLSAGMSGQVYAGQLGRLSSSAALGGFSPEQMNALAIGATRFGGSPSVNMMGLSQLMLYLMHPPGKKQEKALAGLGLGKAQRQRMGGYNTLMTLLGKVNAAGGVGMGPSLKNATDDTMSIMEENGLIGKNAGISGGGSDIIARVFGRIQSQRVAAILANLMTEAQVKGTPNQTISTYLKDVSDKTDQVDKRMAQAMDYRRIQAAANAMHNFGIEVGTALSPLLNPAAKGITSVTSDFNKLTPHQQLGIMAGGAVGGSLLLRRLSSAGRAGGLLRGAGGLSAGLDALSGDTKRGDSPLNPLYVAVVYSLSGPGGVFGGKGGRAAAAERAAAEAGTAEAGVAEAAGAGIVKRTAGKTAVGRAGLALAAKFGVSASAAEFLGIAAGPIGMAVMALSGDQAGRDTTVAGQTQLWKNRHMHNFNDLKRKGYGPLLSTLYKSHLQPKSPYFWVGEDVSAGLISPKVGERLLNAGMPKGSLKALVGMYLNNRKMNPLDPGQTEKVQGWGAFAAIDKASGNQRLAAILKQANMGGGQAVLKGHATVDITVHDEKKTKKGAAKVSLDMLPMFTPPAPQTRAKAKTHRSN